MGKRNIDMTQGNLTRALIAFSVPLMLSGLLQQMYSWADAFIVGNIEGEAALAAVAEKAQSVYELAAESEEDNFDALLDHFTKKYAI